MNSKTECKYAKSHEWVELLDENTVRVGLSEYAQKALGDLVFVNLPQEGDAVAQGEPMGDVESVKAVSDIFAPVTGVVKAVNEALLEEPGMINTKPYEAWFVEIGEITSWEELMDAAKYEAFCAEEG